MNKLLPLIIAFVAVFFLSLSPILVRFSEVDSASTSFFRFFLAFPFIWMWFVFDHLKHKDEYAKGGIPLNIPDIVLFFLTGILYALSVILMFKSYITTSVANASFLSHLMPLIVPFIAFFILGEKINRAIFMGIGLVLVGIMIFIGQDIVNGKGSFWGELDAFLATICLSFWIIIIKTLRARYQPFMINTWYIFGAIYFAAVYTFSYEENLLPHTVEGWVIVAVNAICVQVVGQGLYTYAVKGLSATEASLILLCVPVFSTLCAWVVLGESVELVKILGAILILAGVVFTDLWSKPAPPAPRQP